MSSSVMTWNVENFFPPGSRPSPKSAPITQAQFDTKAGLLRDTIVDMNPRERTFALHH